MKHFFGRCPEFVGVALAAGAFLFLSSTRPIASPALQSPEDLAVEMAILGRSRPTIPALEERADRTAYRIRQSLEQRLHEGMSHDVVGPRLAQRLRERFPRVAQRLNERIRTRTGCPESRPVTRVQRRVEVI